MPGRRRHPSRNQLRLWSDDASPDAAADHVIKGGFQAGCRVHFIGIGGVGMSGIARLLRHEGCFVSGCDAAASEFTEALVRDRIPVAVGHSPRHLAGEVDLVIVSAAIRDTNPELREARRRGITVVKYAQSLGWMMNGRRGIAVSGSHGKTTTTSMIAYALSHAGRNPSMLVGGVVPQLGGSAFNGGNGPFVVEACEYDRSFLNLSPHAAVITNIDRDHLDYYTGLDDLVDAFGHFAERVAPEGVIVANGDDPNALNAARRSRALVETVGESASCTWRLGPWRRHGGRTTFRVVHSGRDLGEFQILVPGLYNIRNALASIAICRFFVMGIDEIRDALSTFTGTRRRFDQLGEAGGVLVLDDYGHHPTEVRVTLDAARQEFPKRRLWCVFQPHQCSRTRLLLNEFAMSFRSADRVIVPDIYSVRDTLADKASVHARDLVREIRTHGVNAEYRPRFPQVVRRLLSDVTRGDLVMTMGAGPVNHVAETLLTELRKREGCHEMV